MRVGVVRSLVRVEEFLWKSCWNRSRLARPGTLQYYSEVPLGLGSGVDTSRITYEEYI